MSIGGQQILKHALNIKIVFQPNSLTILPQAEGLSLPFDTLLVLNVFQTPASISEALSRLQGYIRTREDWIHFTDIILNLNRLDILVDDVQAQEAPLVSRAALALHHLLLDDEVRTNLYLDALRQVVRPTDIVLDIGTGSGILAAGAALAGAKHVYAIEGDSIVRVARQVFEKNGLTDRITLIEGWSTEIELPERADVLVSEIVSNGLFGQDLLRVTRDATQRLLKPGARLIPQRTRLYAILVQVQENRLSKRRFNQENIERWKACYQLDFSPLLDAQAAQPDEQIRLIKQGFAQDWLYLSDPVLLTDIDMTNIQSTSIETTALATINQCGRVDGALLFFEADLTPEITFTTRYDAPARPKSWENPLWMCTPTVVEPGAQFDLKLRHSDRSPMKYSVEVTAR
ncbi:MAG: methyltransferase domain-containing protein [Chloroflexi bacterium]|nr:methyltransferase domain-containing protein [Chloroflexota bacterium]